MYEEDTTITTESDPDSAGYFAWYKGSPEWHRGFGYTREEATACLMAWHEDQLGRTTKTWHVSLLGPPEENLFEEEEE